MQTEIPEDVMKAAEEIWLDAWENYQGDHDADPISVIARAIMAERERPANIKSLNWVAVAAHHGYGLFIYQAETAIGLYHVALGSQAKYGVYRNYSPISGAEDDIDRAKAVAQDDYEQRVRSALVEA